MLFDQNEVIFERIRQDIGNNDIVLYMKGSAVFPQCGFSAAVVQVLESLGLPFKDIDVLADPPLRQGIKDFTNWPTLPQLYVKGEFIGGCDIVREMYASGELQALLQKEGLLVE
ncbi:MAG: Grx4 family monothiol glutaredoxin [Bdellovibrionales bacterium]|jgi:monothiol glutaredoxin|nr:Grx4 family monothiol glutaredoxin [Bdellovibrionales bacterium]